MISRLLPIVPTAIAAALFSTHGATTCPANQAAPPEVAASTRSAVRFIENLGQWPESIRFAADIGGVVARAECEGLGFHAVDANGRGAYVRLVFEGTAPRPEPRGLDLLPGVYHYYIGNDPSRWRTNVRAFAAVEYDDIYPGIDLVLRAEGTSPKYDLILAPGVDPDIVRARWIGAQATLQTEASLTLAIGSAAVHELPVIAWQTRMDGLRIPVEASWIIAETGDLRLRTSGIDSRLPLTIDPEVVWGTYVGATTPGGGSEGTAHLTTGPGDSTFVAGTTTVQSFPTTPGAYVHQPLGGLLTTVTRLRNSDGSAIYAAVVGGSMAGNVRDISTDALGRALVTGYTEATDFPTTPQAFDPILNTFRAAYLFRLSSDGAALEFSTFLEAAPPDGNTYGNSCHADDDGTSIIGGGFGGSPDFPTTLPPIGTVPPSGPQFQGFYGSFVARLDATGSNLVWSRLIGDKSWVWQLAVTRSGQIDLVGSVVWPTLPTTLGSFQPLKPHPTNAILFAMQVSCDGRDLNWSTFLGSALSYELTTPYSLSLDDFDVLSFLFGTNSRSFPTTLDAMQSVAPQTSGGFNGSGLVRLAPDGSHLVCSTFVCSGTGLALGAPSVDRSGVVTMVGAAGDFFAATPGAVDMTLGPGSEVQIGRIDPHGRRLLHLRHFGGPSPKYATSSTVQSQRAVTVGGVVQGPGGMSTTPDSFQPNYPGAVTSGFAITVNLIVAGVTPIGEGTPACHGSIVAEGLRSSASGAADFGLYCSGAPENARGALFIGRASTTPTIFGGAALHIDRAAGFRALRVQTDEFGYLETALPIPALPPGTTFAAQYVFQNHAACQGVGRLSSSNALRLVVQ